MTETNTNSLPGSLSHINTRKTASQVLAALENGPGMLNIPSLGLAGCLPAFVACAVKHSTVLVFLSLSGIITAT